MSTVFHLLLHASAPGGSRSTSFSLALRVPSQGLPSDVALILPKGMPDPFQLGPNAHNKLGPKLNLVGHIY